MSKIIILSEKMSFENLKIADNEDLIIIGKKDGKYPLEFLQFLSKAKEFVYVDELKPVKIAYELGKLVATNDITDIYTDIEEMKDLYRSSMPKRNTRKVREIKKESSREKQASAETKIEKNSKPTGEEKKEKSSSAETKEEGKEKADKSLKLSTIKKREIVKLLTDNGYDKKYASPVMEALKMSTSNVAVDILVRTRVALIEEDSEKCRAIGELIKNAFV